jgi:chromate transporter
MKSLSLPRLAGIYLRLGNLTFGGGDPTMAALYSELVKSRGWLTQEKYAVIYALARITPGTNILAFCAGSGWTLAVLPGAVVAVLATSVPCSLIAILLTFSYEAGNSGPARAAIGGTLAAAVGMTGTNAWQLLAPQIATRSRRRALRALTIACASLLLSFRFNVSPVQVLGLAALAGFLWLSPQK